ncbi:hypothetical protein [Streptomyces sp. SID3343]|nr:hypothetical protein [Streptomyces sp. SID3343]
MVAESGSWPADETWSRREAITTPVFAFHDAREGAAAFAEKRAPRRQGR